MQTALLSALLVILGQAGGFESRIERASREFLGKPYDASSPLGEGTGARYDADPRWRLDRFDCTTYIETVLALATATTSPDFEKQMDRLRYRGEPSFKSRNHFVETAWNPHLISLGLLQEVPGDQEIRGVMEEWKWMNTLPPSAIQVPNVSETERSKRLGELHSVPSKDAARARESFKLTYFGKDGLEAALKSAPTPAVLNIVRPQWFPRASGPQLWISHQALLLTVNGKRIVRHAARDVSQVEGEPIRGSVREVSVESFIAAQVRHPKVGGVQILRITALTAADGPVKAR